MQGEITGIRALLLLPIVLLIWLAGMVLGVAYWMFLLVMNIVAVVIAIPVGIVNFFRGK